MAAFDKMLRTALCKILINIRVPSRLVRVIQRMYAEIIIKMVAGKDTTKISDGAW